MQSGQVQTEPRDAVKPVTLTLNHRQLAWLDAQRRHGSISRSAALRQAIDRLIELDPSALQSHA
jgi:hypothetical protein